MTNDQKNKIDNLFVEVNKILSAYSEAEIKTLIALMNQGKTGAKLTLEGVVMYEITRVILLYKQRLPSVYLCIYFRITIKKPGSRMRVILFICTNFRKSQLFLVLQYTLLRTIFKK